MSDQDETQDDADTGVDEATASTTEPGGSGSGKRSAEDSIAEMRRKASEAEKRAAAAERKLAAQERSKAEEEGRWKELAEAAERERDDLKASLERQEREQIAVSAAARLRFRDPADAQRFLSAEDLADEASADRALKKLAKDKPYLIEPARERTGAAVGGSTSEQIADDPKLAQGQRILDAFTRGGG